MKPYCLAIDQGTHASRACVFDETGKLVSTHVKQVALQRISHTNIEQNAEEILHSVQYVMAEALASLKGNTIAACGIVTQRSSVLAWDANGKAVSPVLSWQDTRGQHQLDSLKASAEHIQHISGLALSAHYGATKLHALHMQLQADNSLRLSPLMSYLLYHLLDKCPYIIDHANAQRTQLFSLDKLNWSDELCELFSVPVQCLPDCVSVTASANNPHGYLQGTSVPVTAINGDQNAAVFFDGQIDKQTALINIGSGAFVLRLLSEYSTSSNQLTGLVNSSDNSIQYVREATVNGAGNALGWFEENDNVTQLWQQLPMWLQQEDSIPVCINGVGGLGSPWWHSYIETEFIASDSVAPTTPQKAIAIIESIVFMINVNLELMREQQSIAALQLSGGLSKLDGLCQRLSNLAGLPLQRLTITEATARGIAWLAMPDVQNWEHSNYENFFPAQDDQLLRRYNEFKTVLQARLSV